MMASITTARHSAAASSSSVRGWRKHGAKRCYKAGLILCLLLASAAGQVQRADEDRVKAAYLYNFAKFVEWPSTSFSGSGSPMLICSIGDERLAEALQQTTYGKHAQGRSIEIKELAGVNDVKPCRILLIAFRDKERIAPILRSAQLANILAVGQSEEFIRLGGIINL